MKASRKWTALVAILLAVLAVSMDGTILSVAVPTLATALKASEAQLQWFSSGYFLVLAAGILPAGRLGDRFGRKKVLVISVAGFGLGSIACALSTTPTEFLIARLALGLAGSGIVVMAVSAIVAVFDEAERAKAVGLFAAANFLALPLGPILGGWLLTHYWWGWVFLINAPLAVIGLVATIVLLPESRASVRPQFDPVGIAISTIGLVSLTYGLIDAGQNGWGNAGALAFMIAGVVVMVVFVLWERVETRRGRDPLLDLSLFSLRSFTWGAILAFMGGLTMIGVLFVMPQFFQGVLGTNAITSGLRLLPLLAGLVAGALSAAGVAKLGGWRLTCVAGFVVAAVGLLVGSATKPTSSVLFIAVWMFAYGLGLGLVTATATSAALAKLDRERSGAGSAIVQLIQKVGAPLGSAILGSAVSAVYLSQLHLTGYPSAIASAARASVFGGVAVAHAIRSASLLAMVRAAFTSGLQTSLIVSALLAMAGVILAIVFMPGRREMRTILSIAVLPADESEVSVASQPASGQRGTSQRPA
jgi:MFS transporter, DHA2 family, multidrug resistance protein